jgi:asparagine synthase (glutamine-hydrolysing)
MCGICGKINFNGQPVESDHLKKMCQALSYRGPDDSGYYIPKLNYNNRKKQPNVGFGHKRLSIIDLSNAGQQPMSNEDGTIWITYNGEIYNYKSLADDLKNKGHQFRSDTDTEVILHLYEEKGLRAVQHLNGMFAFAIWDENLDRLLICRDRIGIKPLVYYYDSEHFVFASEIKALLTDPTISKNIDYHALQLYLSFNFIPAPFTIFKNVRKLEPGHSLVLQDGTVEINSYWDLPNSIDQEIASLSQSKQINFYKKTLYENLNDAVRSRMVADVPLGAFLSGGIDSSIIVALMALNSKKPVKTFSIGFKDDHLYDETHYAREVAERYQTDHHEFKLEYRDLLDVLEDIISAFDEPFADSSSIPTFIVSRETKKFVTVALSGDGGDELFAGYRSYLGQYWYDRYMNIPALFRIGILENIIQKMPDSRDVKILEYIRRAKKFIKATKGSFPERLLSLKEVFPKEVRSKIILDHLKSGNGSPDPALNWISKLLSSYESDPINRILYTDFKDSLPGDMLTKVDLMSMKNSLEVRVPFLDHRVAELAFRMNGSLKLSKGKTKYILKETFKHLLPASIYNRPKAGFEVPISRWLRTDIRFLIDQYLNRKILNQHGIFDFKLVDDLIRKHMTNETDTSWMLWNLITFQCWYEKYF